MLTNRITCIGLRLATSVGPRKELLAHLLIAPIPTSIRGSFIYPILDGICSLVFILNNPKKLKVEENEKGIIKRTRTMLH